MWGVPKKLANHTHLLAFCKSHSKRLTCTNKSILECLCIYIMLTTYTMN